LFYEVGGKECPWNVPWVRALLYYGRAARLDEARAWLNRRDLARWSRSAAQLSGPEHGTVAFVYGLISINT
jgi:hypothetical protein